MARAKQEHDGYLAAFTAGLVVAHMPFTATAIDPVRMNPFREIDPAQEAEYERVKAFIRARGIAALGSKGKGGKRKMEG